MVANNRKMNDLKITLQELIEREKYLCDCLDGFIEAGMLSKEKLEEFISEFKCPEKLNEVTLLQKEEIMNNPYLRDIKISETEVNNIKLLKKRIIFANTIALYREKQFDLNTFKQINSYFICDRTLRFPAVVEGDTKIPWMTVEPMEITSFQSFVDEAKGKILLGGCGLGYVTYMLSLKNDVESITVIELNDDIIKMFEENILPQFKNREKVKIIKGNAIEYLQNTDLSGFDYINVDIWRDTLDMLYLYLPCLEVELQYPDIKFSYWLETELKTMLQKAILRNIADVKSEDILLDEIARAIVENTDIKNRDDVRNCLELKDFREILRIWYINNKELFEELKIKSEEHMETLLKKSDMFLKKIKEKK